MISLKTINLFLSHLSTITPDIGPNTILGIVTNAIILPIIAVDPVSCKTKNPKAIEYMASPNEDTN